MKYSYLSLWKWSYLGWIIPGLLVTTILVLVLYFGKDIDSIQLSISIVSCVYVFAICTIGFITQLVLRYKIIKDILYIISINNESETLIFRKSGGDLYKESPGNKKMFKALENYNNKYKTKRIEK